MTSCNKKANKGASKGASNCASKGVASKQLSNKARSSKEEKYARDSKEARADVEMLRAERAGLKLDPGWTGWTTLVHPGRQDSPDKQARLRLVL